MPSSPKYPQGVWLLSAMALFCVALAAYALLQPSISDGIYTINGEVSRAFSFPLRFHTGDRSASVTIQFSLRRMPGNGNRYHIIPDDCIESITVNQQRLEGLSLPACDYVKGFHVDLSPLLDRPLNLVEISLLNHGGPGGLRLEQDPSNIVWIIRSILLLAFGGLIFTVFAYVPFLGKNRMLRMIVVFGILLRLLYMLHTPWNVRGYDTDGHIEYAQHIATHWSLPDPEQGWQFYQPPLYYLLAGSVYAGGDALALSHGHLLRLLQLLAFFLSCATLFLGIAIGRLLFSKPKNRTALLLFSAILATAPSLIFAASRINNDVLLYVLGMAAILLALHALQPRKEKALYGSALLMGLGLLIKSNAALLLPLLPAVVFLRREPVLVRLRRLAICGGIVLVLGASISVFRFINTNQMPALVGNAGNLNHHLRLETSVKHLTTFHPGQVVLHAFNDPWSDEKRRSYFWEYLYRSAFFGEFQYSDRLLTVARALLIVSMILLFAGCMGLLRRQPHETRPLSILLVLLLSMLAGHFAFRIDLPVSSAQDFRYSLFALIPISYLVARLLNMRLAYGRPLLLTVLSIFISAQAAFVLGVMLFE